MQYSKKKGKRNVFLTRLVFLTVILLLGFVAAPAKGYASMSINDPGTGTTINAGKGSDSDIKKIDSDIKKIDSGTGSDSDIKKFDTDLKNYEINPDAVNETYPIYYETDGGMINSWENPFSYQKGVGVASFGDAKKEGYAFDGWYSDNGYSTRVYSISSSDTGTKTLYAKYIPNTYAINYELNGSENASSNPASYQYGTGVASFGDAKKEGYSFDGWYTDNGYTAKITSLTGTDIGNKTLFAKFTPCSYAITYVTKEGAFHENNPSEYIYGTGVDGFSDASLSEYTFEGWFLDEEFTKKAVSIPADAMGDITLYAKFTAAVKDALAEPSKDTSNMVTATTPLETTPADTDEHQSKFSDYLWILLLLLLLLLLIIIISIIARKVQKSTEERKNNAKVSQSSSDKQPKSKSKDKLTNEEI